MLQVRKRPLEGASAAAKPSKPSKPRNPIDLRPKAQKAKDGWNSLGKAGWSLSSAAMRKKTRSGAPRQRKSATNESWGAKGSWSAPSASASWSSEGPADWGGWGDGYTGGLGGEDWTPRMVFVTNLPASLSRNAVQRFFAQAGEVEFVQLMHDEVSPSQGSKGKGFVVYSTEAGALAAIKTLNGCKKFDGERPLVVMKHDRLANLAEGKKCLADITLRLSGDPNDPKFKGKGVKDKKNGKGNGWTAAASSGAWDGTGDEGWGQAGRKGKSKGKANPVKSPSKKEQPKLRLPGVPVPERSASTSVEAPAQEEQPKLRLPGVPVPERRASTSVEAPPQEEQPKLRLPGVPVPERSASTSVQAPAKEARHSRSFTMQLPNGREISAAAEPSAAASRRSGQCGSPSRAPVKVSLASSRKAQRRTLPVSLAPVASTPSYDSSDLGAMIHVSNIPPEATVSQIQEHITQGGGTVDYTRFVAVDLTEVKSCKGHAIVKFCSAAVAEFAIELLDKVELLELPGRALELKLFAEVLAQREKEKSRRRVF